MCVSNPLYCLLIYCNFMSLVLMTQTSTIEVWGERDYKNGITFEKVRTRLELRYGGGPTLNLNRVLISTLKPESVVSTESITSRRTGLRVWKNSILFILGFGYSMGGPITVGTFTPTITHSPDLSSRSALDPPQLSLSSGDEPESIRTLTCLMTVSLPGCDHW